MENVPPPPYSASGDNTMANATPNSAARNSLSSKPSASYTPSHFTESHQPVLPQSFGLYGVLGMSDDMVIALSADSRPIFHISIYGAFSSQASVVLHSSPSQTAPPMATAEFHSFSSTVDVMISNRHFKLENQGVFNVVTSFQCYIGQTDGQSQLERFEWKSSFGEEVYGLRSNTRGMKCVRSKTGEVVAGWAKPHYGNMKKGKMSFLMREKGFGDPKFEALVLISMLSIMENARRTKSGRHRGAGAFAGAFGGAIAAGGGGGGGGF